MVRTVAVVGNGIAGVTAALTLRADGFDGRVVVIGDEPVAPYRRTVLSKEFLHGTLTPARMRLRPLDGWWAERIEMRTGCMAVGLDPVGHVLGLDDGSEVGYDVVLLATGGRARTLPQAGGVPGVRTLRTLADAERLRPALAPGARIVVVGAGLVGLEVAARARVLGCEVTVLESAAAPLPRVLPPALGEVYARLHRSRGVVLRTNVRIDRVERAGDAVVVSEADGRWWVGDVVLVATGMAPDTSLAELAGIEVGGGGIVVDARGRTSAPDVYAAGDVCDQPNPLLGGRHRVECWRHAQAHGAAVARSVLGDPAPFTAVPWYLSEQYGVSLLVGGRPAIDGDLTVHGAPDDLDFAAVLRRGGAVVGAVAVNRPAAPSPRADMAR
ncbi:NAD(P)/FAD-dependent oxidoreductase [Actinokineospora iranica]|uniref:Pyridine nucleotide-disulphide oxidoreductase n=1 Tax=Actinokineospora iranica TaxID=1271860 RepID=A0A1G6TFM8_9PSEU|nr:FAD-dependent oxidoreductase [Actinokineospora iranica]SDD27861.1 Pyridine nucleotide-disulphide oxidoreductase [Actinokineospora iranica]